MPTPASYAGFSSSNSGKRFILTSFLIAVLLFILLYCKEKKDRKLSPIVIFTFLLYIQVLVYKGLSVVQSFQDLVLHRTVSGQARTWTRRLTIKYLPKISSVQEQFILFICKTSGAIVFLETVFLATSFWVLQAIIWSCFNKKGFYNVWRLCSYLCFKLIYCSTWHKVVKTISLAWNKYLQPGNYSVIW